ncbi:hypothetical protein TARUN_3759 [Trichoderma arundinaceum]|uniref:CBM-cenC domain-containing protein n=1 Tax=Trichoderma arundinaceum TaxID=490622 RepID=A0A395NR18_TRIAR|nr:hypothetical protein TARUN_3759 [Trichoderma arundinaceum]
MMDKIILGVLGVVASVAASPLELAERSTCKDDSLYRCFTDKQYSYSASAYCSALAPYTQTITAVKPTVTRTVWKTSTAATSTNLINSITTVYTATVPSSTEIVTSTDTETVTATATATVTAVGQSQPVKRVVQGGKPQPPKCMLNKCFVYSPDRIIAACGCMNVPPRTVTVTNTACSTTKTVTSTSTITPSVTVTKWQTVMAALTDGVATTTTTVTTTTTATTTAIVTATPPAQNLIPNGDFSSGLSGWSVINTAPAAWVNAGVSAGNGPDGISNALQVTNIANQGLFFVGSQSFTVQGSSTYTYTFYVESSSTDTNWSNHVVAVINCGTITVVQANMSQATQGPNGYLISTTTFNTPTKTDSLTLQQLKNCQAQLDFTAGIAPPSTWYLAGVSASYVGPIVVS